MGRKLTRRALASVFLIAIFLVIVWDRLPEFPIKELLYILLIIVLGLSAIAIFRPAFKQYQEDKKDPEKAKLIAREEIFARHLGFLLFIFMMAYFMFLHNSADSEAAWASYTKSEKVWTYLAMVIGMFFLAYEPHMKLWSKNDSKNWLTHSAFFIWRYTVPLLVILTSISFVVFLHHQSAP